MRVSPGMLRSERSLIPQYRRGDVETLADREAVPQRRRRSLLSKRRRARYMRCGADGSGSGSLACAAKAWSK